MNFGRLADRPVADTARSGLARPRPATRSAGSSLRCTSMARGGLRRTSHRGHAIGAVDDGYDSRGCLHTALPLPGAVGGGAEPIVVQAPTSATNRLRPTRSEQTRGQCASPGMVHLQVPSPWQTTLTGSTNLHGSVSGPGLGLRSSPPVSIGNL